MDIINLSVVKINFKCLFHSPGTIEQYKKQISTKVCLLVMQENFSIIQKVFAMKHFYLFVSPDWMLSLL